MSNFISNIFLIYSYKFAGFNGALAVKVADLSLNNLLMLIERPIFKKVRVDFSQSFSNSAVQNTNYFTHPTIGREEKANFRPAIRSFKFGVRMNII